MNGLVIFGDLTIANRIENHAQLSTIHFEWMKIELFLLSFFLPLSLALAL